MTRDAITTMLIVATEEAASHQKVIDGKPSSEEPTVPIMFLEDEFCRGARSWWDMTFRDALPGSA